MRLLEIKEAEKILPLVKHSSPFVVGSVLRYLRQHYPETAKPVLLDSLKSSDPIIRQNAIDELDELNCLEALPQLRALIADPDADVKLAAATAVANLEIKGAPDASQ